MPRGSGMPETAVCHVPAEARPQVLEGVEVADLLHREHVGVAARR